MEINWTLLTYIVVIYFALSGLSRGWWKEAITTFALAILLLFLQNPDWARSFIILINQIIAAVWQYIPTGLTGFVNDGLGNFLAIETQGGAPYQIDPAAPETWFTILSIVLGAALLIGRFSFAYMPTFLGRVLGAVVGGVNGWLLLSIAREYLDGRALPGNEVAAATSEITLVGVSSFGPPSTSLAMRATDLPSFTVMDSFLPWVVIGGSLVFLFAVFKTRLGVAKNAEGGRKIDWRVPPFYQKPKKPQKPEKAEDVIKKLFS